MFNFGIKSVKLLHRVAMHDWEIIFVDGKREIRVARFAGKQEIVGCASRCEMKQR